MDYEKLGAFYLGRRYDSERQDVTGEPVLYDAKDLTTHAAIIGMTGSGKTGLGVALIEEALIDGVPVIAIDPKGDLGNLLLTFPSLAPDDFRPWIDESDALRAGRTPDEQARFTAELWRKGLAEWGQTPERIARLEASCERAIYTPGSHIGRPLAALRSFAAPPPGVAEDTDALRERIGSAASGLLGLLGVGADPLRSREHILLSTLLEHAWRAGRDLDLATLIQQIQAPPVQRVGVLDLESFFPGDQRFELAMLLNNLLASPGFDAWSAGDPLDVGALLHADDGRPRLSVLSIAHLGEAERMFFVTLVLNELVAWMRTQPGSRSLRAILYMDEVFGYFPPSANPPSKKPMLTLLKQARAYGLGCVLATQNPVDLDYKGLSNTGTWFIGRLQTERDKARVIDGLEGARAGAAAGLDRADMERTLAGLASRVFLMKNVHEDAPVVFHTRWVLSYLAGPLARDQIRALAGPAPGAQPGAGGARPGARATAPRAPERVAAGDVEPQKRPVLPPDVRERFLPVTRPAGPGERLVYRPALAAQAALHYANARAGVDEWVELALLAPFAAGATSSPWAEARSLGRALPELPLEPEPTAHFAELPAPAARATSYPRWARMLETHLYREHPVVLWQSRRPRATSLFGETEGAFRGRLRELAREERDLAVEKLRKRWAPRLARVEDQIRRAEQRVEVEQEQYSHSRTQSAISIGATFIGALLGRKLASSRSVGRATTAARSVSRAARQHGDIERAEERVATLRQRLVQLERDFRAEVEALEDATRADDVELRELRVAPRKADLSVDEILLVWTPWRVTADGIAEPAFETPAAGGFA